MSICLIVCSSLALLACDFGEKPNTGDSDGVQKYVELSDSAITMEIYSEYTLTLVTNMQETVVWTTSNATVATVEDGVITAHLEGSATITATAGKESASCVVTVTHLSNFPELTLSDTTLELVEGGDSLATFQSAPRCRIRRQTSYEVYNLSSLCAPIYHAHILENLWCRAKILILLRLLDRSNVARSNLLYALHYELCAHSHKSVVQVAYALLVADRCALLADNRTFVNLVVEEESGISALLVAIDDSPIYRCCTTILW